jgi:cytochrome c2
MSTKWKISGVIATVCLMVAAQCAHAQPAPTNAATGQKLAEQLCSECHVVVPNGHAGWTDAPAFDVIANRPGNTAAKLSAFIQKQHMHMLNTARPRGEANAIAAYIVSLRKN